MIDCSQQPENLFPGIEWSDSHPEDQGVDPEKLAEALKYLEAHSLHNGNWDQVYGQFLEMIGNSIIY